MLHFIKNKFIFIFFLIATTQPFISCNQNKNNNLKPSNKNSNNISGELFVNSFYSNELQRKWKYSVYISPTFHRKTQPSLNILYLLHGHGGNETSWMNSGNGIKEMIDSLVNTNSINDLIIIMPDGGNSWFVDGVEKMESAIMNDLLPEVEKKHRNFKSKIHRSIGGMSAGGYGSLRLTMKYPSKFENVILMSPAVYTPTPDFNSFARFDVPSFKNSQNEFSDSIWKSYNYPNYWNIFDKSQSKHTFYLSTGTSDCFKGIIKAVNFTLPNKFSKRKSTISYQITNFEGGHEMNVWKQALEEALLKIYKK